MTGSESPPVGTNAFRVVDSPARREEPTSHAVWVSPSKVMRKRTKKIDLLDMSSTEMTRRENLSSPKRVRQQEWSSPHRVIDRPKPEDSHGNWVTLHCESKPSEEDQPISQATYTVRRSIFPPETDRVFVRKVAVLDDFNPSTKKRTDHVVAKDRIKRTVQPDGRVVKVSTLDDFSGLSKLEEKRPDCENAVKAGDAAASRTTSRKTVLSDLGKPSGSSPRKTRFIRRVVVEKKKTGSPDKDELKKEEDQNNKENKPRNGKVKDEEGKTNNEEVDGVMTELEKILNDRKDEYEATAKRKTEDKKRREGAKKAKNVGEQEEGERQTEAGKKRRRDVDLKAVQKYIKMQKMKRLEQLKMEREKKAGEEEARKKKLEELRMRTLQLAAASKRKVPENVQVTSAIKIVEPPEAETEEDVTMSLGLKQSKPRVSYNESILNLKKRPQVKLETKKQEVQKTSDGEKEDLPRLCSPKSTVSPKVEAPRTDLEETTNLALKKLAETLQKTMEQQKKTVSTNASSLPCKSYREASVEVSDRELGDGRKVVTVDVETIKSLKQDIKKISQNFQILHEIITDKAALPTPTLKEINPEPIHSSRISQLSLISRVKSKPNPTQLAEGFPSWLRIVLPRPHPYNVLTAVRNKIKLTQQTSDSNQTSENTVYSDVVNSGSGSVPVSSNPLTSLLSDETEELATSTDAKMEKSFSEDNYFSLREDSGSELSSSILDSDKERFFSKREALIKPPDCLRVDSLKGTPQSSVTEDITSMGVDTTSVDSKKVSDSRESLVLVPPDVQLKPNTVQSRRVSDRSDRKSLTIYTQTDTISTFVTDDRMQEIGSKSEAFITEIEDTATESVKSKPERMETTVTKVSHVCATRSVFNPEALHLQIQAELSLLETFQRSLAHFLDEERIKVIAETNVKVDKAVNTEEILPVERKEEESVHEEDTESVKTELDVLKTHEEITESIKTETDANDFKSTITEVMSEIRSAEATDETKASKKKSSEKLDISDIASGISFQMLNRMMKDEELRSEHQLALIRLREKTLDEKVKAELTLLEMRKKALKEKGSSEDQAISAIKKKQRGILLKYQNEKEDIERLKKMHRIASEERKIMIKQQKQIRQMQLTTKDMLIKLRKREKSPQKRTPVKQKTTKYNDSQSEIPEAISLNVSENTFTESITSVDDSINHSIESDLDVTSKSNISEGDDEILRRNMKTLEEKISKSIDKCAPAKMLMTNERKHLKRGHSAEELLKWTKRLEEKENRLKEMEVEAENLSLGAKHRLKSFRDAKASVRDRSTSPFQFQEVVKSICESSPSLTEAIEAKKSSSIAELIESNSKSQVESRSKSSETVPEKVPTSASEDIPEEFSKKTPATSRSAEYNSESFESSSDTHKSKAIATKSLDSEVNTHNNGITIKMPLSPRVHASRRRYSSGSDESVNLFHTETASEQSDVEIRIAALHEQLRTRKLEAERLRREQKKAHRERLKAKEQSLLKQIEAYDTYIQKKKQELEQEYERSSLIVVKPVVKQLKSAVKRTETAEEEIAPLQTKFALRNASPAAEKDSDSEIAESIKDEGTVRGDTVKKTAESSFVTEVISDAVNKDSTGSSISSMLESLPRQTVASDGSHSESEELTVSNESVKTTLLSPEKADLDVDTEEIEPSEAIPSYEEGNYSEDSFESDEKSKSALPLSEESKVQEERSWAEDDQVGADEGTLEPETVEEDELPSEEIANETPDEVVAVPQKDNTAMVNYITDSVLDGLVTESVAVIMKKRRGLKEAETESGVEVLTNILAAKIVSEVIDDAVSMYNRRKRSLEQKTQDVRRRVHEIMSQAPGTKRQQRRPQDIMVTTYDVAAQDEDGSESPEREEFLQSLSPTRHDRSAKIEVSNLDGTSQSSDADPYGQEWFDDDFGLSRTRREAEELRVQQLQIEQEIQQLQAQQEQVLYYYLRQIPNKPPPPYTPPGTATTERFTSESEVTAVMSNVVRYLTDEMNGGSDVKEIQPPEAFFSENDSEHVKCYKTFLFDLAKHIISGVIGVEFQEDRLPWMRTIEKLSKYKVKKVERTYESLFEVVMKQVLVLFGFRQKMGKERLIVRWSRKKRDHVDELLVGESQEEEAEWTHYDEDEVTVKNNVTIGILDSLLDETAQLLNAIWTKKMKTGDQSAPVSGTCLNYFGDG